MTSFLPSVASPPELICTGFSSQRKVALPPNGETNRPQMQPETTKKSKTDFFNKTSLINYKNKKASGAQ